MSRNKVSVKAGQNPTRLRELKNEFDPVVDQAFESMRKIRESRRAEDPYELFGQEGKRKVFSTPRLISLARSSWSWSLRRKPTRAQLANLRRRDGPGQRPPFPVVSEPFFNSRGGR
jgi:hypothetical protein